MEVSGITTNSIEPQKTTNVNMRGKMADTPQAEEKDPKEALTNPMETVGRSQVNFRGTLSAKDLNKLAGSVSRLQMNADDIVTMKKALANTLKKYKCADIEALSKKYGNDMDASTDFMQDMLAEAAKINPKADLDKIGLIVGAIF